MGRACGPPFTLGCTLGGNDASDPPREERDKRLASSVNTVSQKGNENPDIVLNTPCSYGSRLLTDNVGGASLPSSVRLEGVFGSGSSLGGGASGASAGLGMESVRDRKNTF